MLVFASAGGPSEVEQAVARVQWACAADTIESALKSRLCDRVVLATAAEGLIAHVEHLPVIIERDEAHFHFGRRLRDLIHRHGVHRALYVGAGSTALLRADDLAALCQQLRDHDRAVIANNFWSVDFAGFVPATAIDGIELPEIDNNLAFLLNRTAGLPQVDLPRNGGTQFDVDTPTDLLILALHNSAGPRVREVLGALALNLDRVAGLARLLTDVNAEVVVAGRVGASAWAHLEAETACRIRMFSEERGMRASGREDRGEARSLLGFYFDRFGPKGLFDALAELGDAAIVDSRVIFAHLGWKLSAPDRFNSDLLAAEQVIHPPARQFTAAAREAKIPILLGGHSLVSGGLLALVDAAWRRQATL